MEFVNVETAIAPEGKKKVQVNDTVDNLFKAKNRGLIVRVPVIESKNYKDEPVWILDFDGILGYVDFERSGLDFPNQMGQFVGQEIYVKISYIRKSDKGTIVTANRKEAIKQMSRLVIDQLEEGQVIESVVKGVGDHNVYVDIGGGCIVSLPRKQATLSNARKSLRRYYSVGDTLEVKVTKIDKENEIIQVSHTATLQDPWKKYKFNKGDVVVAEIINIVYKKDNPQIYAEVKPGLDSLLIYNLPIEPNIGDKIQGQVLKYNPDKMQLRVIAKALI